MQQIAHKQRFLPFTVIVLSLFYLFHFIAAPLAYGEPAAGVAIMVNGNAITQLDIEHRIALLKLQQRKGNLKKLAQDELIEEMLKRLEAHRQGTTISNEMVEQAYDNFARQNHMPPLEFSMLLNNIGVTAQHFQDYIRNQIEWMRTVSKRYQMEGGPKLLSQEQTVQRMLANPGQKPEVKEYRLQQIILVVPHNKTAQDISRRKREAALLRSRIKGCETIRGAVKNLIDVTIRDLGPILEPQLPPEWRKAVANTKIGNVTPAINGEHGFELLAICGIRKVSDDRVAQLMFSIEDASKNGQKKLIQLNNKYLKELKAMARIQYH